MYRRITLSIAAMTRSSTVRRFRPLVLMLASAILGLGLPAPSRAGLYVFGNDNGAPVFGILDVKTGDFNRISNVSTLANGLDFASNGTLYGTYQDSTVQSQDFATFSTKTGGASFNQYIGDTESVAGASNGTLYGIGYGDLETIDSTTGTVNYIGSTLPSGYSTTHDALTFDSKGTLYGVFEDSSGNESLFTVNTSTGAVTLVGPTGLRYSLNAPVFVDGTLYGLNYTGEIYSINTTTGAATDTGIMAHDGSNNPIKFIFADAFQSNGSPSPTAAPEPASLTLLGMGLASLAAYRWRRRRSA